MNSFLSTVLTPSQWMANISWIMFAIVMVIVIRLCFELRSPKTTHKAIYTLLVLGIMASALLFFHRVWAVWSLLIVVGFLLGCTSLAKNRRKGSRAALGGVGGLLVVCGLVGINSPFAPVLNFGPSMWPTSPKGMSVNILNTGAFNTANVTYGDDVYFETPRAHGENWPAGRFRKRIWGLPGDKIEVRNNTVLLNGKVIADCSNRSRRIAANVWWCTVHFPNNKTTDVTWGLANGVWIGDVSHTVGEGQVFAIGDNTVESTDSREMGPIDMAWIEGRFDGHRKRTAWEPWPI